MRLYRTSRWPVYCLPALLCLLVVPWPPRWSFAAVSSGGVLFEDSFDGPTLDETKWGVGTWQLGRTQLGQDPTFHTEPTGVTFARLPLSTYASQSQGTLVTLALGTELFSKTSFALPTNASQGLQFEARVRLLTDTFGLVASFFTWGAKTGPGGIMLTDEIDFEDLTNTLSGTMLLTSFNDWDATAIPPQYGDGIHHEAALVTQGGLDRHTWHTLQIRWWSDHTEWYINGQLVRSSRDAHPNDPMTVRFNFWAPTSDWNAAYSPALPPNVTYFYDIDYVRVTLISRRSAAR